MKKAPQRRVGAGQSAGDDMATAMKPRQGQMAASPTSSKASTAPQPQSPPPQGAGADNWIAGATKNKGGLHRSLGVPAGKKIPAGKIAKAAQKGGKVGKQARLAQTLKGLNK